MQEITLGKVYRDSITKFEGYAVSRHEYLNGCVRIALQSGALREGKVLEPETFDIQQLEFVGDGLAAGKKRETGGPGFVPPSRFEPKRA